MSSRYGVQCSRMFSVLFVTMLFLYCQGQVIISYASCNQTVIANSTAMCHCTALAKPTVANIIWLRNGSTLNRIQPTYIFPFDFDNNCDYDDPTSWPWCVSGSKLVLFNTQTADSGSYTCYAGNKYSSDKKTIKITVQVPPVITTAPSNYVSKVLKIIKSDCVVTANPRAVVQWKKNGKLLSNRPLNNNKPKILITNSTEGNCTITDPPCKCKTLSRLQIFNTQYDDNGEYSCTASNEAGSTSRSATFTVTSFPIIVISPTNENLVEYHNISFTCTASGYPRPEIEWLKDDIVLTNNNSNIEIDNCERGNCESINCVMYSHLWVLNATINDLGSYTCNATNLAGSNLSTAQLTLDHNDGGLSVGDFVGIAFGVAVLLVVILAIIYGLQHYLRKRYRQRLDAANNHQQGHVQENNGVYYAVDNEDGDFDNRDEELRRLLPPR